MITSALADQPLPASAARFGGSFFDHFALRIADTPALMRDAFHLRFQVYCREMRFECEEDFPEGLESDGFDARSVSILLCHRASGRNIGCVRLIFADPADDSAPFPFETVALEALASQSDVFRTVPRTQIGEVSRLAVVADFRRRRNDQELGLYAMQGFAPPSAGVSREPRRHSLPPAMGLVFAAACLGLDMGLQAVFVMMELRLARMLRGLGLGFRQVCAPIDYHGLRAPFEIERAALTGDMPPALRAALDAVREHGVALRERALACRARSIVPTA